MNFQQALGFVQYLRSGARNPRMQRRLGELESYLISLKGEVNRLRGL